MVELTREHMGWVEACRWKYFARVPLAIGDDLVGIGMLALVKCAINYDASKGASFKTHVFPRVRGAMQDHQRTEGRSRIKPFNRVTGQRQNTETPLTVDDWAVFESYLGHDDPIGDWELTETLDAALATLTPREQCVVRLHYLRGWSLAQVGALFDLTESRISQIATAACVKLRPLLDREALAA